MINGIINIYKESGFTSHDVVAKMRGILKQKKIGHTGTLDPDAIGVLPVCLGNATKLSDLLADKSKEYVAQMQLGICTDTQDISGKVLEKRKIECSEEQIITAILGFVGDYNQMPPMYSALKVNGKKLYELAREGIEIERKTRPIRIDEIEILEISLPMVHMRVSCSKGTYIRTLCHDIGDILGCGGTMYSLKRTRVGTYKIENAVTLTQLEQIREEGKLSEILEKPDDVFKELPNITIKPEFQKLIDNGNSVFLNQIDEVESFQENQRVRVYNRNHIFYGIFEYNVEQGKFKPIKMFLERDE